MTLIARIAVITLAAAALLLGIQAPGFVDQYQKRLDAHYLEVKTNLAPFQAIADQFQGGSLDALIAQHDGSPDPSFHAEGQAIRTMHDRVVRLEHERAALDASLPEQIAFLATQADRDLMRETRENYSFGILLNREAVIAGVGFMLVIVVLFELVAGLSRLVLRPRPRARHA